MNRAALILLCVFLSGCALPFGVSSRNQSGGVTAESVGTVNQTIAPRMKSPYLAKLQEFYAEGGGLSRQWTGVGNSTSSADIKLLAEKSSNWVNGTFAWIAANITQAAAERFAQTYPTSLSFNLGAPHPPEDSAILSNWRNNMPQWLSNLDALMRSDAMYPQ